MNVGNCTDLKERWIPGKGSGGVLITEHYMGSLSKTCFLSL